MAKVQANLNGTWYTVYQEFEGRALPIPEFEGQKLLLQDSTYTLISGKVDEGIIKANGNHLDIYGTDGLNKGRHYVAIYKINNSKLTICYNLGGNAYPADFKTAGHPHHFLAIFERG